MKNSFTLSFLLIALLIGCSTKEKKNTDNENLIAALETAANEQLLHKWYPLTLDTVNGGYYSDLTYDFKIGENQNKMIVTQARHVWTNAVAAEHNPERKKEYLSYSEHGFQFLRDYMWDEENGGFHTMVTKEGEPMEGNKTAYGNSFAIYGLAAYYGASKNEEALDLAKKTFNWLEEHSHDSIHKGYYQILQIDGTPVERTEDTPSTSNVGYKDYNSSIHLLEALTTLYEVWPDAIVEERVKEMLTLIRDTFTTEKGYMNLYFEGDWTPISFKDSPKDTILKHFHLDHVTFGHDVETAFLMLEASHVLGGWQFDETLVKGKKMVDHSLKTGWDKDLGGFYDGGYYFKGVDTMSIVNHHKNWWTQAEGLNSLLLMDSYFPNDSLDYRAHFDKLWEYTNTYLMDKEHGGWYAWGQDTRPETKNDNKGHIWKSAYHNYRALATCKETLEKGHQSK
ncbi:AGE family epimerase/isomerase [Allomuricauda sp. CP2A]|jgi:mannobiose 2-epimerase|uniref:AGE family epimerase/isomerase n=1 Tax=Allomuricauda sp. CP2A TaxID=1848189 RepID=UPI000832FDD0|nr:AGE family epimerase/isomerase [Muricauda sp. CP2A]